MGAMIFSQKGTHESGTIFSLMPFVFQLPTSVRYDSPHFLWYTYASLLRWLFKNEEIDLYSIDKPRKVNV